MKYAIRTTKNFDKQLKKCQKRGYDMSKFKEVVELLASSGTLPAKYRQHKLSSQFHNAWECHIQPDWLLVWEQNDDELILILVRTGTHADLFG